MRTHMPFFLIFCISTLIESILAQLLLHGVVNEISELLDGHGAVGFAATLLTNGNESFFGFFLADDEHVRDALQLVVADLAAEFLVAVIYDDADVLCFQHLFYLPCVIVRFLGDRQHDSLVRREPERELVSVKVRIPSYPKNVETSESLNVSIATGIILAYLRHM